MSRKGKSDNSFCRFRLLPLAFRKEEGKLPAVLVDHKNNARNKGLRNKGKDSFNKSENIKKDFKSNVMQNKLGNIKSDVENTFTKTTDENMDNTKSVLNKDFKISEKFENNLQEETSISTR